MKANGADTVRVSWTGANADSCALDGAGAAKSGSKTFGPYSYSDAGSQSATVSCTNRLGAKSATAAWTVEALPPAVSATLSRTAVTAGTDRVDLSWSSNNSDSCAYDNRSRAEIRKQMKEEAIHRYNAGGVGEYWEWNAGTKMWKPVDRVRRGGKTETLGYVSKVVGVTSYSLL